MVVQTSNGWMEKGDMIRSMELMRIGGKVNHQTAGESRTASKSGESRKAERLFYANMQIKMAKFDMLLSKIESSRQMATR